MQIIKNWLNGQQNYIVGQIIYNHFGHDEGFKALMKQSSGTFYIRQKLASELQKIVSSGIQPSIPLQQHRIGFIDQAFTQPLPKTSDSIITALEREWKPLYKQMAHKRSQLIGYGNDNGKATQEACYLLCKEILELEQQINSVWAKKDHYSKTGRLPDVPDPEEDAFPTDPLELSRYIENLKRNIRRTAGWMKNEPGNPKYAQLNTDYQKRYQKATGSAYVEKTRKQANQ